MQRTSQTRSAISTSNSRELHEAALRVLPGGTSRTVHQTKPHPIYARDGAGAVITDVDGNRYLDFYNNATSLIHGHAHPAIVGAIEAQARRGTAFSMAVETQVDLATMLADRIGTVEQVRFVNSGTEAVLLALKVARALTDRPKIVKFEGLYHGSADAVEVSLDPKPDAWGPSRSPHSVAYTRATPTGLLDDVIVLPFNDLEAAEVILRDQGEQIAAVIFDVLPMRLGFAAATGEWVQAVRRVTRDHGILLISDEVVSFRLDLGGAQSLYRFDADLTVLGKTIGGGLPVGALAGPKEVMATFDGSRGRAPVPNAGTFNANPITLAAGMAAMKELPGNEIRRINELGEKLRRGADDIFERLGVSAHSGGSGSLFALHMTDRRFADYREFWYACIGDARANARQLRLYDALRERGILLTVSGVGAISTAMTEVEVGTFLSALTDAVGGMEREGMWAEAIAD